MNCSQARESMLIAELEELHGTGDTQLAAHIGSCGACSDRAAQLASDLDSLTGAVRVRASSAERPHSRRVALLASLPVAAALLVAVTLAMRDKPIARAAAPSTSRGVSVDPSPGQRAAVFATSDPTVTVVWLSPGVGQ